MVLLWHHLKNTHWNLCFEECMRLCSNCSFQIFLTNCPQFFFVLFFWKWWNCIGLLGVCSQYMVQYINISYYVSVFISQETFSYNWNQLSSCQICLCLCPLQHLTMVLNSWGAWDSIRVRGITVFQTFMYIHCPNPLTHSQFTGFHIVHMIE